MGAYPYLISVLEHMLLIPDAYTEASGIFLCYFDDSKSINVEWRGLGTKLAGM